MQFIRSGSLLRVQVKADRLWKQLGWFPASNTYATSQQPNCASASKPKQVIRSRKIDLASSARCSGPAQWSRDCFDILTIYCGSRIDAPASSHGDAVSNRYHEELAPCHGRRARSTRRSPFSAILRDDLRRSRGANCGRCSQRFYNKRVAGGVLRCCDTSQ
jgi:hypothetical protein